MAGPAGNSRSRRVRRAARVLVVALAAGCSVPGAQPHPGARPHPDTQPHPDAQPQAVAQPHRGTQPPGQILAAYQRFWLVAQRLDQQPPAHWPDLLAPVAAEPLLSRLLAALAGRVRAGYRQYGEVRVRPRLVAVHPDRASVLDCQDAGGAGEIDTATGLPTEVGAQRTPVAATLVRGSDAGWRVSDARYLPGDC
jgi:hypothetical protein